MVAQNQKTNENITEKVEAPEIGREGKSESAFGAWMIAQNPKCARRGFPKEGKQEESKKKGG